MKSSNGDHPAGQNSLTSPLLSGLLWFIAVLMFALLVWVVTQRVSPARSSAIDPTEEARIQPTTASQTTAGAPPAVPEFHAFTNNELLALNRLANAHTIIPERSRDSIASYVVEAGDSVFSIAKSFKLEPETVLWANEDLLQDNPNDLSVGQKLKIPPVDGIVYKWKTSDSIDGIARKFKTTPEEILTWPENNLDLADPKIDSGTIVMVPGGSRALRTWVVPTFWRANAGAEKSINSNCDTSGGSMVGTSTFLWPTSSHLVSGNEYWSGHLGLDIGAAGGAPVYATDGGVVVYSGPISGGYGLMVMIDHGNGFHSLYAHLSQIIVKCGQNVGQGRTIAYSGSTGNSTGPHLHFEIRFQGAFVNPRDYIR